MLDIKLIREQFQEIQKKIHTKEPDANVALVLELDESLRKVKAEVEALKNQRNTASKKIGEAVRKGEDVASIKKEVEQLGDTIALLDEKERDLQVKFDHALSVLPNIPEEGIKVALDPKENVELRKHGTPLKKKRHHLELNQLHGFFDFERAAKTTGSHWPCYKGMGARLEWALLQFLIDFHVKRGYMQWIPPLLIRPEMLYGSGQLPKFAGQVYKLDDPDHELYLIPTAEVILNAMHFDEILEESELPKKYVSYTPCFRREAGAAGKQERGLIRTHQFNKVEMFAFCKPVDSSKLFEEFVSAAESLVKMLELPYRVMLLVTGDMSYAAAKTIDLEVWLPGQDRYQEVSSISNCTDFQARRSKIRYRPEGEKPQWVHTLNGSGLATSRLMVGLLENHQMEDGSIYIPPVLRPYLGGIDLLRPPQA